MVSLLLVEDNAYVASALDGLLGTFDDMQLGAVAQTGEEALERLPGLSVDLALVDLALPGMSGIEFIAAARKVRPDLSCIILSAHREESYVKQALSAGARGYITKEMPLAILEGIERVMMGEVYLSEDLR